MSEAARARRDELRYEPQAASGRDATAPGSYDPLAELARLVGQEDRFRGVFRPESAQAPVEHRLDGDRFRHTDEAPRPSRTERPPYDDRASDASRGHPEPAYDDGHHGSGSDPHGYDAHGYDAHGYDAHGYDAHGYDAHGYDAHGYDAHGYDAHGYDAHGYDANGHDAHGGDVHAASRVAHPDDDGRAAEFAAEQAAASTLPDVWARGADGFPVGAPQSEQGAEPGRIGSDRPTSARRPVAVLAAVLLLTGGGLAASFLAKNPAASGVATAGAGRSAPTILAAPGPTKLKVADAGSTTPEDQDAVLLNKAPSASSGTVKIVSSQEQPADLSQLPKASDLAAGARPLPPASPSPFPEPKKVKTFVVHPDGSMLSPDAAPSAADPSGAGASASSDVTGSPVPATPKTAARGATTPKAVAPPDAIAALTTSPAAAVAPPKPARQPAAPGVHASSGKPNDTADVPATPGSSYGVQLSSSPVEAEAHSAFAKLKKKYPNQLGSLTATVYKAETGDKPVYRVRVGSMSQDEAKALCSQLQGAGGSCFVVHN